MGAIDIDGIIIFLFLFGGVLRAVLVQNGENLLAMTQGKHDLLRVLAAAVFVRLRAETHFDAEGFERV